MISTWMSRAHLAWNGDEAMHILSGEQEQLLKAERTTLTRLRDSLLTFGASSQDCQTLGQSIEQLDELFLLVVVGEFNAGKSALINALLGERLLKEGVTPTTTQINVLKYAETAEHKVVDEGQQVLLLPSELLAEISIVDTPGTNAIMRSHEALTTRFIPRSDLVLFITSVDRPFTESERAFLERIRDWGKKVVIVLNKIDMLPDETDRAEVKAFVSDNARTLLGLMPEIFAVSARLALRAKQGEPALWQASGFEPFESYIHDSLDEDERLRLKLLNPLGVATFLGKQYLQVVASRLDLLSTDLTMLADVEADLEEYKSDMQRDFSYRMADIDNVLLEMVQRGDAYFDETLRLARVFDLMNKDRIQREFAQRVVGNVPLDIERKVTELIDWLVDADLRQWQGVTDHLAEQRRLHKDRIVGDSTADAFHYDRERLMQSVGREAQRVVESFDKTQEAQAMAEATQVAVAASAAIEVGAVGLGALVAILATTMAADVTGILLSSLIAVLGLFVIPRRRRQAKADLHTRVSALREQLSISLRSQFGHEMERSVQQINDAIAPYTRFVRSERGRLLATQTELQSIKDELDSLKGRVDGI
jgi:small GTP-binding protein